MKILITASPMIREIDSLRPIFTEHDVTPIIPQGDGSSDLAQWGPIDGWIFGDEVLSKDVLEEAFKAGIRAAVKWGAGLGNVDFTAARALALFICDLPLQPGEDLQITTRRALQQLIQRFRVKGLIQRNATQLLHQRFTLFDI